jgi:spore germination protein
MKRRDASVAIHVVSSGETLWAISVRYEVSINLLQEVNGLFSDFLMPGLALYIPNQSQPERFYAIQPADNLWKIAEKFNTSIAAIMQENPGIMVENLLVGQVLRIPTPYKYTAQTLAFIDAFIPQPITEQLNKISTNLTYLAIFSYSVLPDGTLTDVEDTALIQQIKAYNIKPLMVLSNYESGGFSPELASQVLETNTRYQLVQNIVQKLNEKGYSGISLDFEAIPASLRDHFTAFLRELKAAMGNLVLQVNVFSKTWDMPTNPFAGAFDYYEIGKIADIVTVLTYDYGYTVGPPDPVAPVWWIDQVLSYATSLIPRKKLMMAIPLYGYEWILPDTPEINAVPISINNAQNQALQNYAVIQYNTIAQAPYYLYEVNGYQHIVWFEDPRSIEAKYRLMESYELLGAAFWRLRYEFPQNWSYLDRNVDVVK